MKDIKIVFIDLDGTLKDSNQKISIRNKIIFEKLRSIGIQIVFTTGRSLPYTMALSKQFSSSNYVITSNGSEVYNYLNDNIIYSNFIKKDDLKTIGDLIKKYDLYFVANSFLKTYTNKTFDEPGRKVVSSLDDIMDENISQLIVESFDIDKMKVFRRDISSCSSIKISNKSRNPQNSKKILFYDITNSDVSKGNAIKILCDYLNVDISKTMAFGDSDNDLEMFEAVKIKVAVSNSNENLKNMADYVTLSNDQDGVAIVLENLYDELTK